MELLVLVKTTNVALCKCVVIQCTKTDQIANQIIGAQSHTMNLGPGKNMYFGPLWQPKAWEEKILISQIVLEGQVVVEIYNKR